MDPQLGQLLAVFVTNVGAAVVKKLSKSKSETVYKWLTPVAAVGIGIGIEAATGTKAPLEAITAGTGVGGTAVLIHQLLWKGLIRPRISKG